MAEYISLENIAGLQLPDGKLVSTRTLTSILEERFRGPPVADKPPVAGSRDDPHVVPTGRHKGRLRFFGGEMEETLDQFFRYYRDGKYFRVETLRQMYFPHAGRYYKA